MIVQKFRKSSYSNASGCVEVAVCDNGDRLVRHSKHPDGPVLTYTEEEWDAHVKGVKDCEFDV